MREVWEVFRSLYRAVRVSAPYLLSRQDRTKEVTEQYPDPISSRSPEDLPARARGLVVNVVEKCTACGDCVTVCPSRCIRLSAEAGADVDKYWVSGFVIDYSSCAFCGLCVEACIPGALQHEHTFDLAARNVLELTRDFGRGQVTEVQREKWASERQARAEEGL